jgi:hypothetical protein
MMTISFPVSKEIISNTNFVFERWRFEYRTDSPGRDFPVVFLGSSTQTPEQPLLFLPNLFQTTSP